MALRKELFCGFPYECKGLSDSLKLFLLRFLTLRAGSCWTEVTPWCTRLRSTPSHQQTTEQSPATRTEQSNCGISGEIFFARDAPILWKLYMYSWNSKKFLVLFSFFWSSIYTLLRSFLRSSSSRSQTLCFPWRELESLACNSTCTSRDDL